MFVKYPLNAPQPDHHNLWSIEQPKRRAPGSHAATGVEIETPIGVKAMLVSAKNPMGEPAEGRKLAAVRVTG